MPHFRAGLGSGALGSLLGAGLRGGALGSWLGAALWGGCRSSLVSALRASGRGGNRCGGSGRVFQSRLWTRCASSKSSFTGGESQGEWRGGV